MALPVGRESPYHTLVRNDLTTEEGQLQFQTTRYKGLVGQFENITRALEFKGKQIADLQNRFARLQAELGEAQDVYDELRTRGEAVQETIQRVGLLSPDFKEYNEHKGNPREETDAAVARIAALCVSLGAKKTI